MRSKNTSVPYDFFIGQKVSIVWARERRIGTISSFRDDVFFTDVMATVFLPLLTVDPLEPRHCYSIRLADLLPMERVSTKDEKEIDVGNEEDWSDW